MDRFLQYEILTKKAGLNHQTYNLKTLISEAYCTHRIPVISNMFLFGYHNDGKELCSDLSAYYDFKNVTVKGELYPCIFENELPNGISRTEIMEGLPLDDKQSYILKKFHPQKGQSWSNYKETFSPTEIVIPYQSHIWEKAQKVVDSIGTEFTCVHVRRRDVLKNHWRVIWHTRPGNIKKVLDSLHSPNDVYVMSDETKKAFFNPLSKYYSIHVYNDYDFLRTVKSEDNYQLFCIEKCIRTMAKYKVSTFDKIGEEDANAFLTMSKW